MDNNDVLIKKQKLALIFFNKMLETINADKHVPINDLTEFKDINRDFIIGENCLNVFDDMLPDILKVYTKCEIRNFDRKKTKNYILTICRILCAHIGYKFEFMQKDSNFVIDGNKYRKAIYLYSIVKKIE